jgi:hypothetical protein
MTSHTDCRHSKDSKGRTACRKAGGPQLFAFYLRQAVIEEAEAICEDCFNHCRMVASDNLDLDYSDDEVIFTAREYMLDRSALSACTAHSDRLD